MAGIDQLPTLLQHVFSARLKAAAVCFAAGALAALSMAPLNAWPVLFISLPLLYAGVLYAGRPLFAAFLGWLFGFGYFVFSLSWIGNAMLVDNNPFIWVWPLAVCGLPALLAFFPATACFVIKKTLNLRQVWGWLGFISFYCAFEWLRGHIFTGFPWNLFGYTWAGHLPVLQVLSISDVYMLSWLSCFWALVPALFFLSDRKAARGLTVIALLVFCANYAAGAWRLQHTNGFLEGVQVRLVQPNIAQADKWKRDLMAGHFEKHLTLSWAKGDETEPVVIVWPETALSYSILNAPGSLPAITEMLKSYQHGAVLLTGLMHYDPSTQSYSNALVMIDDSGHVSNVYAKHHLVPFGEYIPFQEWIPLTPVTRFKGFQAGPGNQTFSVFDHFHYSPLICYEIIFPGNIIEAGSSPDFVVNVTNDAWYGVSAGPYQHFEQALYRAIETSVPVIRVANTGFSGIVSPTGTVYGESKLFTEQNALLSIPKKINNGNDQGHKGLLFPAFLVFFIFMGLRTGRLFSNVD